MNLNISNTKAAIAKDFANYFAAICSSKKTVHIALSGGSTPRIVFDELAANFKTSIDWSKVHLYWGDERCVPPSDAESNYKMTVNHLISKIDIPEKNIHRIKGENNPVQEVNRYAEVLVEQLPLKDGLPHFDLIILGLGDDGHTASIFPHEIELWHSDKICEVAVHPDSGQKRITITGNVINNAEVVAFLVTGASKTEKVREIIKKEAGFEVLPASLVAPTSGHLKWFLDHAAAAQIR